jgi:hypothetical protein
VAVAPDSESPPHPVARAAAANRHAKAQVTRHKGIESAILFVVVCEEDRVG